MDRHFRKYTSFTPTIVEHVNSAEPDQSLSIEEILRNVATTGVTGLPRPIAAVYDDDNNYDFDDESIQPEFDQFDALDALESHRRNARSLKKQIEAEKAHSKALKDEKLRADMAELDALRKEQAAKRNFSQETSNQEMTT